MEHRLLSKNLSSGRLSNQFWILLLSMVIFAACKEPPIEHPESSDPIYNDLGSEAKTADAALAAEKKSLEESKKNLAEMPVYDPLRGQLKRQITQHEHNVVDLEQKSLYFKVRQEQRKENDEKVYPQRYEKGLPWPDPQEIAEYREMKKLRTASMNWNDRVPKTNRYSKKPEAPPKEEKPKAAHGE